MAILPTSSSCLELTISMPGSTSSPSVPSSAGEIGISGMRDLDINQVPLGGGGGGIEEEWTTGSMEDEEEMSGNNHNSNNNSNNEEGGPPRKKLRLSKEQSRLLEESFRQNHTLNPKQKEGLAEQLKLKPRQVEVWFQNRRARSKLKQTEMECEYLKRWFGSLTEQNRRLQKEVEELRAMKVGPPTVISPNTREPLPASTLTMCPCCQRVTTTSSLDSRGPTRPSPSSATTKASMLHPRQPSAAC
ncbi:homeobox-leucine zipper protein HOX3 [Malania oleifera]|uniref:homeobox-leucine zipper protein HOX3 n=1 Tax=Malania oleifera TaxID=397392 RepID=UPI0025AEABB5|nr:homeobox-leucine zipper protein HOX3 [Malania oleifera]